jgi:PAS domain S-box-containing protein
MDDFINFFSQLLDPSGFPARWQCGRWTPGHGWLHILSDLGIWSAYFAIPLTLGFFVRRREDLPFRSIFLLFAAFILLCGSTHLMEAIIFWWPAYRLAGVLKLITAVVSWLTVFALIRVAPAMLSMRSPQELERLVRERTAELKDAVATVEAERELLRTTLASIGDAVITTDLEGRVRNMNGVAELLTGWSAADAAGQRLHTVFNIVNEETRRPVENPALRALKENVVVGLANHTILIRKDGSELPIDDSAAPIRKEGATLGCVLVFRDITERKRQQAELVARERQFVTLAESIPQLCWMANPDGHIFWYNRRWYDYTGTTAEQMEGWGWQSVHDPEVLPSVLERWRASLATGRPFEMVFPLRGKDETFRPFLTRVEPLRDDEGHVVRWFGTNTDISEQKRTEEALAKAERESARALALLDSLVTNAPIGIGVYDHDLRFVTVNPALAEMNGLSVEAHVGKAVPELLPDIPLTTLEAMRSVLRTGEPVAQREVVGRTPKSLEERTWFANFFPVKDAAGAVFGVGATVIEITDLRRAEHERERALLTLNALVEAAPMGLAVIDHEMKFLMVNKPLADMNGVPADAHLGKAMVEIAPGLARHAEPIFRKVLQSGGAVVDESLEGETPSTRDQQRVWLETWFPVGVPGQMLGVGVIVQDITEQRAAQRRLQFQLDLNKAITDNATTAIFMMDDLSRCTFVNPAAERMTGFSARELAGGILHDFIHHQHPDGRPYPMPECPIDRALPEQFDVLNHEDVFIRKNGEFFPVVVNAKPIRDGDRPIGTVIEVRDVTHEKETAAALREVAAELSEANRKKDEFLATLAHELRNPLAPIRTGLHLLKLAGDNRDSVERLRTVMERQLEHMVRLVDDLLDVSRITRGKLELRKERVPLATVIESAVEASRPLIDEAGHELTIALPPQPVELDADPTRLAQVFLNLLNNAAKYTERGGRIRLAVERQDKQITVSVTDTGIGMAPDALVSIFDMFHQAEHSLEKSRGGLGIGLTLVKRLVEMHGGHIEARSAGLGMGSEFVVTLPVAGQGSSTANEPDEAAASRSALRILVVDDNHDACDMLVMLLEAQGNETHAAHDGQEGVAMAERLRPDVILFDIGLPKLNGYEACRKIREQSWGKDMFVIAVTGWGQDEDRRRSRDAGFNHHMVKPVDVAALEKVLAEAKTRSSPNRDTR